jgi:hypothetical protein
MTRPLPNIPAHARRTIARLEMLLAETQHRLDREREVGRKTLYELVDLRMQLQAVRDALEGGE